MKKIALIYIAALVLTACNSAQKTTKTNQAAISENSKLSALLWQQTAAEYTALCYQAFNVAASNLTSSDADERAKGGKTPAIVLDLDETVLNNSPYNGYLIKNNSSYSTSTWRNWTDQSKAKLVPGAKEFIELAYDLGYEIYFISNRSVQELESTISNLQLKGIRVEMNQMLLKEDVSSKAERRAVVNQRHHIFMLIGDNLADFDNVFEDEYSVTQRKEVVRENKAKFGHRFIVLPNIMYGNWEKSLKVKDEKYKKDPEQKGFLQWIKSY